MQTFGHIFCRERRGGGNIIVLVPKSLTLLKVCRCQSQSLRCKHGCYPSVDTFLVKDADNHECETQAFFSSCRKKSFHVAYDPIFGSGFCSEDFDHREPGLHILHLWRIGQAPEKKTTKAWLSPPVSGWQPPSILPVRSTFSPHVFDTPAPLHVSRSAHP